MRVAGRMPTTVPLADSLASSPPVALLLCSSAGEALGPWRCKRQRTDCMQAWGLWVYRCSLVPAWINMVSLRLATPSTVVVVEAPSPATLRSQCGFNLAPAAADSASSCSKRGGVAGSWEAWDNLGTNRSIRTLAALYAWPGSPWACPIGLSPKAWFMPYVEHWPAWQLKLCVASSVFVGKRLAPGRNSLV